jgi:hypothetical protein
VSSCAIPVHPHCQQRQGRKTAISVMTSVYFRTSARFFDRSSCNAIASNGAALVGLHGQLARTRNTAVPTPERVEVAIQRRHLDLSPSLPTRAYFDRSFASAYRRARSVDPGVGGNSMALTIAMIARTQTISSKKKPRCPASFVPGTCLSPQGDVGSRSAATLLAVRSIGHDVVGAALARSTIKIGPIPRIIGYGAALQIRTIPR